MRNVPILKVKLAEMTKYSADLTSVISKLETDLMRRVIERRYLSEKILSTFYLKHGMAEKRNNINELLNFYCASTTKR